MKEALILLAAIAIVVLCVMCGPNKHTYADSFDYKYYEGKTVDHITYDDEYNTLRIIFQEGDTLWVDGPAKVDLKIYTQQP